MAGVDRQRTADAGRRAADGQGRRTAGKVAGTTGRPVADWGYNPVVRDFRTTKEELSLSGSPEPIVEILPEHVSKLLILIFNYVFMTLVKFRVVSIHTLTDKVI